MMFLKSSQNAWNIYVEDFNFSEVLVFELVYGSVVSHY